LGIGNKAHKPLDIFSKHLRRMAADRPAPTAVVEPEEILIAEATERITQAREGLETFKRIQAAYGVGPKIPLADMPEELRNLKIALGALMESDAEAMRMVSQTLDDGGDAIDVLRHLGEFGDDELFFPLDPRFITEHIAENAFEVGWKPFGVSSQGPTDLVDVLTAVERFKARGGMRSFLRHYDKLHNLLKGYMIMKPGFHMRNFFSAVFMNYLDGVELASYRQFQNAYWNYQYEQAVTQGMTKRAQRMKAALVSRGIFKKANSDHIKIIRQMDDEGILGGAQGQIGMEFTMTDATSNRMRKFLRMINPGSSRNLPLRISRGAGVGTETYVRGVMGFDTMKRGGSADEAFGRIMKFHFDYSDLSDFERRFVKRVVPFYVWTRHNLPLMIEQMGQRPGIFNQYNIAKGNLEAMSRDEGKPIPDWMERQMAIRLPFKYEGENMMILPDLPFKTPMEMLDPMLARDLAPFERILAAASTFSTQVTPLIKSPIEWATRRNLWKGYTFRGSWEQVPTAYKMIPLLMPALEASSLAHEREDGEWLMRDYNLHAMASYLPTFADMRRLFPSEERYQQRTLSTWMSFLFGIGLRTNTKEEQQRTIAAAYAKERSAQAEERKAVRAGIVP